MMYLKDLVIMIRKTLSILVIGLFSVGYVAASPVFIPATVFISEIHYDNTGTDKYEGIVITGPAGTSLEDWSVIFYNGRNGESYKTIDLTEQTIPQDGFVVEEGFSIQNGGSDGDGVALVHMNKVVEFLSYEGSFKATNDLAEGMMSIDIVAKENGKTPIGYSLQLMGLGTDDLRWDVASMNALGEISYRQSFEETNDFPEAMSPMSKETSQSSEANYMNLGEGANSKRSLSSNSVPEPHIAFLLLMGIGFLWLQRKVIKSKRAMMSA